MADIVMTFPEKLRAFVDTAAGKFVIASVLLIVILSVIMNFKTEDAQQLTFKKEPLGKDAIEKVNDKSFTAAWRDKMERDLGSMSEDNKKLKKQLASQNKALAESIDKVNHNLQTVNKNQVALKDEMGKAPRTIVANQGNTGVGTPDVGIPAVGSEDFGDNPFKDIGVGAGAEVDSSLQGNVNIDGVGTDVPALVTAPGEWDVIEVGGSKSDIRDTSSKDKPKALDEMLTLPAGSFIRGRLLTGVMAPTEGIPWPVLIRTERAMIGPNGASYPLDGCFVVANATGHMGTTKSVILPNGNKSEVGRVKIEVQTLTCDWGHVAFDASITGFAQDMDGQFGIEGVVHNRFAKELMFIVGSSSLEGAGKILSESVFSTTTTNTPGGVSQSKNLTGNIVTGAAGQALTDSSREVKKYLLEQAKKSISTIEIPSNIKLDFFLTQSVSIPNPTMAAQKSVSSTYGKNGMY